MTLQPEMMKALALCAVATWGITEASKPLVKKWIADAWKRAAIRLSALLIGGAFGFALAPTAEGALTGFAGASLSAVIVTAIKARLQ